MAWKNLKWDPAKERLEDFVYKFRRIATELGYTFRVLLLLRRQWKTLKELVP